MKLILFGEAWGLSELKTTFWREDFLNGYVNEPWFSSLHELQWLSFLTVDDDSYEEKDCWKTIRLYTFSLCICMNKTMLRPKSAKFVIERY